MATNTNNPHTEDMHVDDDGKDSTETFRNEVNAMSVDTPADGTSEEVPLQPQLKEIQLQVSPQKKDERNTINIDVVEDKKKQSTYHGEYHKALVDTLSRLLDGVFKKYLFHPYSTWLPLFEESMKDNSNKIMHFYPILLEEIKKKITDRYLNEFEHINAAQNLAYLQHKMTMTFYDENSTTPKDTAPQSLSTSFVQEDVQDDSIRYTNPKRTQRDQQMMKINETFRNEIAALDQKIAMAEYKKNELMSQIEEKKKTLFTE